MKLRTRLSSSEDDKDIFKLRDLIIETKKTEIKEKYFEEGDQPKKLQ